MPSKVTPGTGCKSGHEKRAAIPTPVAEALADAKAPEADNGSPEEGAEAKGQRGQPGVPHAVAQWEQRSARMLQRPGGMIGGKGECGGGEKGE